MAVELVPVAETAVAGEHNTTAALVPLAEAAEKITGLVQADERESIERLRASADAQALYERHAGYGERERHFACLRLLAEAALGCLSWDDPEIIDNAGRRANWRVLAAALERGKLLAVLEDHGPLSTTDAVRLVREAAWTTVPGEALGSNGSLGWAEARVIARDRGIDPTKLPSDTRAKKLRAGRYQRHSAYMHGLYLAERRDRERRDAESRRSALAKALRKEPDSECAKAFALLRQTTQAMDRARISASGPDMANELEEALSLLYEAEVHLARARGIYTGGDPGPGWLTQPAS